MANSTRQNRDKLMSMMAMSEEIGRTNNKIYSDLSVLAENPEMKDSLYSSIDDLIGKVNKLKAVELGNNFIEQERIELAPQNTIAPTEDPDYKDHVERKKRIESQRNTRAQKRQEALANRKRAEANPVTPEEEAYNEELEEATNTPQPPVPPKRNVKKNTRGSANRQNRQRPQKKNFSNLGKGKEGTQQD